MDTQEMKLESVPETSSKTAGTDIALLVIHGIGQQHPFEALDRFTNGLRKALNPSDPEKVKAIHRTLGRQEVFDHRIELEAVDSRDPSTSFQVHIYEFYWANLCQGKASLRQVLQWLVITVLTPLRRLAFNLPLVRRRVGDEKINWKVFMNWEELKEFGKEIWRCIYLSLIVFVSLALMLLLVREFKSDDLLLRSLQDAYNYISQLSNTEIMEFVAFMMIVFATVALGVSLYEQFVELYPRPSVSREFKEEEFFRRLKADAAQRKEFRYRYRYARYSVLVFVVLILLLATVFRRFIMPLSSWQHFSLILFVLVGIWLKRVFVDYLGDISDLYSC